MKAKKIGKSLLLGILLILAVCGTDFLIIMLYRLYGYSSFFILKSHFSAPFPSVPVLRNFRPGRQP